jgi:hypothetical protein
VRKRSYVEGVDEKAALWIWAEQGRRGEEGDEMAALWIWAEQGRRGTPPGRGLEPLDLHSACGSVSTVSYSCIGALVGKICQCFLRAIILLIFPLCK